MPELDNVIFEALPHEKTVSASMRTLIDAHTAAYPHKDWTPYYNIPYDSEIIRLKEWLLNLFGEYPPAELPVACLYFGLYDSVQEQEGKLQTIADFYVSGGSEYEWDGDGDWASCPEYFPEERYAASDVLYELCQTANRPEGIGTHSLEFLCLGYVAFTLRSILSGFDNRFILASDQPVGVAVGWDSGDIYYLGHITSTGFQIRDPKQAIAVLQKQRQEFESLLGENFDEEE